MRPATLKLRSLAAAIDFTVFSAVFYSYVHYFGDATEDGYAVQGCGHLLVLSIVWFVWFPLPEALWGRTLGKWACDLRAVDLSDQPITLRQALLRHVFDIVDTSFFGLTGLIAAKTTALNQRVGDLAAHTKVVDER